MKDINLFKTKDSIHLKKINSKADIKKDDECDGYFIDSHEKNVRSIVASLKSNKIKKIIAVQAQDGNFNRRILETIDCNYLVSLESYSGKDSLKQRDSGLNHVLAKIAATKKIAILLDTSYLKSLTNKKLALTLEKIIQNIKICRKAKCKIKTASLASTEKETSEEIERKALGTSLGMSSQQVADSVRF